MISIPQPSSSTIISNQIRVSSALVCAGILTQGVNAASIDWAIASGDYAEITGAIFNSAFRLNTPAMDDLLTMSEVVSSSVAMTAIAASSVAMAAILDSNDTALPAVVASSTAMAAVAASATAMGLVAADSPAMTAIAASSVAMAAVAASSTAMTAISAVPGNRAIFMGSSYSVGLGLDTLAGTVDATLRGLNTVAQVAASVAGLKAVCTSAAAALFAEAALQPYRASMITLLDGASGSFSKSTVAGSVPFNGILAGLVNTDINSICIPYQYIASYIGGATSGGSVGWAYSALIPAYAVISNQVSSSFIGDVSTPGLLTSGLSMRGIGVRGGQPPTTGTSGGTELVIGFYQYTAIY